MSAPFTVSIDAWNHGAPIPAQYAFGKPGDDGPFAFGGNVSPAIQWSNAPTGTKSFVLLCHDPDVPSSGEDVNQEGKTVPASLPRVDFFHWVLFNIPATCTHLEEGFASQGIVARGKPTGPAEVGVHGSNNYTQWFAGDADMEGTYGGYDGPCPPWNDSIVHHYHFTVFALDVEEISTPSPADGPSVREAIQDHILAQASHMGTYSMNPDVAP